MSPPAPDGDCSDMPAGADKEEVHRTRRLPVAVAVVVAVMAAEAAMTAAPARSAPVPGAPACPLFPADSYWHADVSALPVHPRSGEWVAAIGADRTLKADFGSGTWDGGPIGIPYTTVGADQPPVEVSFEYEDESDPGPYPIPPDAPVEGGPSADGDRHVVVVDRDACRLHELFDAHPGAGGSWRAGSGATWDLRSNAMRPAGWTSADAAGLPILPGLVRYDEVAAGAIDHAIRVTVPRTDRRYVWPARHQAGTADPSLPPMGLWLRLKAEVDISRFPSGAQVVLRALRRHGMIVADNGSPWFIGGVPDERWDDDVLRTLGQVRGSMFEAVDTTSLVVHPDSGAVAGPAPADPAVSAARIAGADRVTTSVALSRSAFAAAQAAVVATGEDFPDALAAAPLAAAARGPVLLSSPAGPDEAVRAELRRLGVRTVYLMGGTDALGARHEAELAAMGVDAVRLAGADRFATAAAAARRAAALWRTAGDPAAGREVLVASGDGWADALSAGPLAAVAHRVLLLVTAAGVPAPTAEAFRELGGSGVTAVGGTAAVPDHVLDGLGDASTTRRRIAGGDRYATAAALAAAAGAAGADGGTVLVATGTGFADGLAAGAAAGARRRVLLLAGDDHASQATLDHLARHDVSWLRVAGGPAAVPDAVVRQLLDAA